MPKSCSKLTISQSKTKKWSVSGCRLLLQRQRNIQSQERDRSTWSRFCSAIAMVTPNLSGKHKGWCGELASPTGSQGQGSCMRLKAQHLLNKHRVRYGETALCSPQRAPDRSRAAAPTFSSDTKDSILVKDQSLIVDGGAGISTVGKRQPGRSNLTLCPPSLHNIACGGRTFVGGDQSCFL